VGNVLSVEQDFRRRVAVISGLGLGLSVDVYSPDLFELMRQFNENEPQPSYLEVFRATVTALQVVRKHLPTIPLAYHGEGLWVTQPDFSDASFFDEEIDEVARQLETLQSPWLNHECATKQMAGYSFGTYLPPLYTVESARVVAGNIALLQEKIDRAIGHGQVFGPLFLLELPPLTYFMAGTISIPLFFRLVTDQVSCGLVLDIGHLWTVYRYTAAGRQLSVEQFVERFLDEFPMERIVEIHIAGLDHHESNARHPSEESCPEWVDAHAAPIQAVSWSMLEQVLAHPRLTNLRAVALEVDTKPIKAVVNEFRIASERCGPMIRRSIGDSLHTTTLSSQRAEPFFEQESIRNGDRRQLQESYARYAQIASGQKPPTGLEWQAVVENSDGLDRYVHNYLPHEILYWGGELAEMFPETCRALAKADVALDSFVTWWFQTARPVDRPYDFFLLKIERMLAFVGERAPVAVDLAEREAETLRQAYAEANNAVHPVMEPAR
jgi:uncharacterized protein